MWCGRGVVPKPMRIQREGAQLQIRGTWSAGPGDDQARFLADLRALRDSAAIGFDELAARAHYPSDVLKEAENGPSLPGLPILTAYVRACDGDVPDWEERWRRLKPDVPDDPDLPVRPAGASPAAQAGARAGVGVAPPDVYDPERIKAALRGGHARTEHGGRRTSDPGVLAPAPSGVGLDSSDPGMSVDSGTNGDGWSAPAASPGWDPAPGTGVTLANGNQSAALGNRGPFDAAFTSLTENAEPSPSQEFSWLKKDEPESRPAGGDLTWPEQTGNGGSAEPADGSYGWSGRTQTTRPAVTPASWTAADTTPPAAEPAHRTAAVPAKSASTQPVGAQPVNTGTSQTQAAAHERDHRQDRYFPARLLAVIVIAALIGSALVLLLK